MMLKEEILESYFDKKNRLWGKDIASKELQKARACTKPPRDQKTTQDPQTKLGKPCHVCQSQTPWTSNPTSKPGAVQTQKQTEDHFVPKTISSASL